MKKPNREAVKKKLAAEGFPFRDELAPVLEPLITEFHGESRNRIYPPEVVAFTMIASVFSRDDTLRSAVARNNASRAAMGLPPASMSTAAISEARSRLHPEVLVRATRALSARLGLAAPDADLWGGMMPYVIDGTTLTAADSAANQAAFPQLASQITGVGMPIMRVVVIQSLTTGMICDLATAPFAGKGTGEMALAREVVSAIKSDAILLGDCYFPSFFFLADLRRRGIHGVFPMHAARDVDFRRGEQIGSLDHVVAWKKPQRPAWMTPEEYAEYPDEITLRELEVHEKKRGRERLVIVTTLTDSASFPKNVVGRMYRKRWNIELALRDLKDTFGLNHINANTPEMIAKIIWAHALAYNVLRWHMLNACQLYETNMENVSVTAATVVFTANALLILASTPAQRPALFASIYFQLVQVPVGLRPGRTEPRAIKRRPKPRLRLQEPRSAWQARQSA